MKQINKSLFKPFGIMFLGVALNAHAETTGGQVFYRMGINMLSKDRGGQVFTDTNGATTKNDGTGGWNIGAGLDLPLVKDTGPGDILGQIMVNYAHYSRENVTQTTSALLGGSNQSKVTVSSLQVVIAPKYRMSFLDNKLCPWIIPAGLAFLVNSPPSNDSTYLDIGLQSGVGIEYKVIELLSVGVDYRHTFAKADAGLDMSGGQADLYVGINF